MPKIGPFLKLASAKLDPSWTVRWITDPHIFRPHTRMPNFMFSTDQATQVAAYILIARRKTATTGLRLIRRRPSYKAR